MLHILNLLQKLESQNAVIESMKVAQEELINKMADMQNDQEDVRMEQRDLKEHTLNRLDAIDEKMEWFLSKGQQGAHPLSERLSQLEEKLDNRTTNIRKQIDGQQDSIENLMTVGIFITFCH